MLKYSLSLLVMSITLIPLASAKSASDLQVVSFLNKDERSVYVLIKNPAEQNSLRCEVFDIILKSKSGHKKVIVSRSNVILNAGEELEIERAGESEALAQGHTYQANVESFSTCEIIK